MIPKTVEIGFLTFHTYGLIFALAIFIGWKIAKERSSAYKIPKLIFDDPILLLPLVLGIIGARIYHVVDYWQIYMADPKSIINLSGGGLGILGGLLSAFLGFWVLSEVKKINLLSFLDLVSPSFLLGQAIGRFGNFVNQEAFGPPTDKPWGIYINPENRPQQFPAQTHFHPTFFYEAAIDFFFFIVLLLLAKRLKRPGQVFALYLILYSLGRFTVEFWRIDTATIGPIKVAQAFSLISVLIGMTLLIRATKPNLRG